MVGLGVAIPGQVGAVDGRQQQHHVAQGGHPGTEHQRHGIAGRRGEEKLIIKEREETGLDSIFTV